MAAVSFYKNEERERLLPRGASYRVVGIQLVDLDEIPRY